MSLNVAPSAPPTPSEAAQRILAAVRKVNPIRVTFDPAPVVFARWWRITCHVCEWEAHRRTLDGAADRGRRHWQREHAERRLAV